MDLESNEFKQRVTRAAEAALRASGSVGPLELLQWMQLLSPSHVDEWKHSRCESLEPWIQGRPEKLAKTYRYFHEWAAARGLRKVGASYMRAGVRGNHPLQVTVSGDPERETFFRTHYAPADVPARKAQALEARLNKAPELVVFETVSESVICSECQAEMVKGDFLFMEKDKPLCLGCADLDRLEFLPSGDAALSRRARKHSPLAAVVVRFSRARRRYERQGLLAAPEAIAQAEAECLADSPERALERERDRARRIDEDAEFTAMFTAAIRAQYPGCPAAEALDIARHAALRGSGRVGRTASGRALDPTAVSLAVVAHIRHAHTEYDKLLMKGADRQDARGLVREKIDRVIARWQRS